MLHFLLSKRSCQKSRDADARGAQALPGPWRAPVSSRAAGATPLCVLGASTAMAAHSAAHWPLHLPDSEADTPPPSEQNLMGHVCLPCPRQWPLGHVQSLVIPWACSGLFSSDVLCANECVCRTVLGLAQKVGMHRVTPRMLCAPAGGEGERCEGRIWMGLCVTCVAMCPARPAPVLCVPVATQSAPSVQAHSLPHVPGASVWLPVWTLRRMLECLRH